MIQIKELATQYLQRMNLSNMGDVDTLLSKWITNPCLLMNDLPETREYPEGSDFRVRFTIYVTKTLTEMSQMRQLRN